MTRTAAEKAFLELTGEMKKLTKAPKHYGTAVFLDSNGRQMIAALFTDGKQFAWRLSDRDVKLKDMKS